MRTPWIAVLVLLALSGLTASCSRPQADTETQRILDLIRQCNPNDDHYKQENVKACTAALAEPKLTPADRAITFNIRGNTYDALGQYDLAIADYEEVTRLRPDLAMGYGNLGLEYCRKGDFKAAVAQFDEALKRSPDYSFAMYGRGVALSRLGQVDAAREQLDKVNKVDPEIAAVYRQIKMEPVTR